MMQYGYRWLAPVDDPLPSEHRQYAAGEPLLQQLTGMAADRATDGSMSWGSGADALSRWLAKMGLPVPDTPERSVPAT